MTCRFIPQPYLRRKRADEARPRAAQLQLTTLVHGDFRLGNSIFSAEAPGAAAGARELERGVPELAQRAWELACRVGSTR